MPWNAISDYIFVIWFGYNMDQTFLMMDYEIRNRPKVIYE
jgi:hypothetical protein